MPRPGRQEARRRQAGYTLVVLIMAVTVLSIMLAAALPLWSEMIKRDKEEELISRGWQYAEAIRVFQKRFQRFPTTLDELIKVKPRCIRQLWKDPMTDDGEWEPIFYNQGSPLVPMPGALQRQRVTTTDANQRPTDNGLEPGGQRVAAGPIVGVHSRSKQKSLLIFFGQGEYDDWQFRVETLAGGVRNEGGAGVKVAGNLSTQWLGRPMESFTPVGNGLPPSALTSGAPPARGGGAGAGSPGSKPPG